MKFLYTALERFDKTCEGGEWPDFIVNSSRERSWKSFIEWSKLYHLTELVSLDRMLNEDLVDPDYESAEDWNYIDTTSAEAGNWITGFYTSPDYVAKRPKALAKGVYNLLAIVIEPNQECKDFIVDGFEFVGYEVLDEAFSISVLTNCGGVYDDVFLPMDLNDKGLINDFSKACDIQKRLSEKHPACDHAANAQVIAVWRHKTIGVLKEVQDGTVF